MQGERMWSLGLMPFDIDNTRNSVLLSHTQADE